MRGSCGGCWSLISGCLLDRLLAVLGRARVPPFFGQFAGAAMMTLVAAGVYAAGRLGVKALTGVDPTVIVVGGIVMLVAGMTIVGAMQDAIDQFYVTASARVLEVLQESARVAEYEFNHDYDLIRAYAEQLNGEVESGED